MTQTDTWTPPPPPEEDTYRGLPGHLAPVEDERAILGACLVSPRALDTVIPHVPGGHVFYDPRHGCIWDAIAACWARGETPDTPNVVGELRATGMTRQADPVYVASLDGATPTGTLADPTPYLGRVLDGWEKRGGDKALTRARQLIAAGDGGTATDILDAAVAEIEHARDARVRQQNVVQVGTLIDDVLAGLDPFTLDEDRIGLSWPYVDLGAQEGGGGGPMNPIMPGQLGCIAGRPAMGKSTALKDLCEHVSFDLGLTSLLVTYEMRAREIAARVMSHQARVTLAKLTRPGLLREDDLARIEDYRAALAAAPLFIIDSEDTSIAELDRLIRQYRPRLVAVDYLQLAVPDGPDDQRRARVERYTRDAKKLAARRETPIVLGSQLNRMSETRRDRTPHLADLRESGATEQDCDWVILLHREDYYEAESPRAGEVDFIVAKQRNGPTDTVVLANRLHYASFHDMAR